MKISLKNSPTPCGVLSNGMHRAFILVIVLVALGGIGFLMVLGSHATYSILGGNLASVFSREPALSISAEAYLITNLSTGEVVAEKNKDAELPIASLTKLFTASAVYDSGKLEEDTLIVWQDIVTEGSAGKLWLGQTYTLRDLLFPLLLSSSNDAAAALVRTVGGAAYASAKDKVLLDAGLTKTHITDSSGLSDSNTSTAAELATFLGYLKEHDPYVLDITRLKSYMGPYQGWINNNPGASFDTWRGGKHGYTYAAGRTFAGIFEKNGVEYVVVLLKSSNLEQDLEAALSLLP